MAPACGNNVAMNVSPFPRTCNIVAETILPKHLFRNKCCLRVQKGNVVETFYVIFRQQCFLTVCEGLEENEVLDQNMPNFGAETQNIHYGNITVKKEK